MNEVAVANEVANANEVAVANEVASQIMDCVIGVAQNSDWFCFARGLCLYRDVSTRVDMTFGQVNDVELD